MLPAYVGSRTADALFKALGIERPQLGRPVDSMQQQQKWRCDVWAFGTADTLCKALLKVSVESPQL
jgi:hypothetical protein